MILRNLSLLLINFRGGGMMGNRGGAGMMGNPRGGMMGNPRGGMMGNRGGGLMGNRGGGMMGNRGGGMMGRPPPLMGRGMMFRDPGFGRDGMRPRMGYPPAYGRGGMRYQGVRNFLWNNKSYNSHNLLLVEEIR